MKNIITFGAVCFLVIACGRTEQGSAATEAAGDTGSPVYGDDPVIGTPPVSSGGRPSVSDAGASASTGGTNSGGTSSGGQAGMPSTICGLDVESVCTIDAGDTRMCSGTSLCMCEDGSQPTTNTCVLQDGLKFVRCGCPASPSGQGGESGVGGSGGAGDGDEGGAGGMEENAPCVFDHAQQMPIQTSSILGSSDGVLIRGSSFDPTVEHTELQFWSKRDDASEFTLVPELTRQVGDSAELLPDSITTHGFLAMVSFSQKDSPTGYSINRQLTYFASNGGGVVTGTPEWKAEPSYGQIASISGSPDNRVIWIEKGNASGIPTFVSMTVGGYGFSRVKQEYVWSDTERTPSSLEASQTGDWTLVTVKHTCAVIPAAGCDMGTDLLFWNQAAAIETRKVWSVRLPEGQNVYGIFPAPNGFDVETHESGAAISQIVRYSVTGDFQSSWTLPTDTRRIIPFRGGFAAIVTDGKDLRTFKLVRLSSDGDIFQTVSFTSEYDRYELALTDLVITGNSNWLAFGWGGWDSVHAPKSTLALFSCESPKK